MGGMSDRDLVREAAAELYAVDPEEFIERRKALVAKARAAGQAPAAKQIAGLRKPTRSAWIVNQLSRADPGAAAELSSLGEELRAAQGSLDGATIRELSGRRRELIDSLARRAFRASGQPAPPAAIRDEVTATLGAALADPRVAQQVAAGTLERAAQPEGFGLAAPAGPPALTLVKGSGGGRTARARSARPAPSARPVAPAASPVALSAQPAADRLRAENERRQAELAHAERLAAEASEAADAATAAEHAAEATVQSLEEQLADARSALADVRARARRARARQRSTRQALDRLRD
jgi:NTP pyrophosphatase (non-canonical NTP hydrolase)